MKREKAIAAFSFICKPTACAVRGAKPFHLALPHLAVSTLEKENIVQVFEDRVKRNFRQRSPQTKSASDFLKYINIPKTQKVSDSNFCFHSTGFQMSS